jgi:AAA domain
MNDGEVNFTAAEQAAFDRVIATFGPDITVGEFEPWGPNNPPPKPKVFQEADQALEDDPDERFRLVPVDLPTLLADGIPEPDYLDAPYLLRGARVWAFGPAESCKTLYFEWVAAHLTRQGKTVVFISAENPLSTDVERIGRLRPDFERLRFYHMPGLDLADRSHFVELAEACLGADLLVADTLSALWSGDEASNAEVVKLDREVLAQLVRLTGVTPVVIHHTGHPTAFVNRSGVGPDEVRARWDRRPTRSSCSRPSPTTSSRLTTRRTAARVDARSRRRVSESWIPRTAGSISNGSARQSTSA